MFRLPGSGRAPRGSAAARSALVLIGSVWCLESLCRDETRLSTDRVASLDCPVQLLELEVWCLSLLPSSRCNNDRIQVFALGTSDQRAVLIIEHA